MNTNFINISTFQKGMRTRNINLYKRNEIFNGK